jgi:hypothetical protein
MEEVIFCANGLLQPQVKVAVVMVKVPLTEPKAQRGIEV